MTGAEILSHILAAAGSAGPAVGLFISERTKRRTAEAQTTTHVAGAIKTALDVALLNTKTTLDQAQSMAQEALKKARECERHRDEEKTGRDECEKRTKALAEELHEIRSQLETSGAITKSDPERRTPVDVVEAWSEGFAKNHVGAKNGV